ncbi:MAG TPA: SMP-30/gluconolactonase/LRE family protein [Flavitalea sp.]|nr:SMP-30/gluconolactonase/LRE family protein [Flavitalea sp.]
MKRLLFTSIVAAILISSCGSDDPKKTSTGNTTDSTIMKQDSSKAATRIVILDTEGANIIDSAAEVENLAGGFTWTEGPLYVADGDYVLFSDIPANKVMKWKQGQGVTTYLHPSGYTGDPVKAPKNEPGSNGLVLDKNGKLVLCQHGDRRIARMKSALGDPKPEFETVADKYNGKRFNSPNDAVYHPNGNLYLTDPTYGLQDGENDKARELDIQGVYLVRPNGKVELVTSEFKFPNGIAVTPDGKSLLIGHSDPDNRVWMKYELNERGLVAKKSVFYKVSSDEKAEGGPDGMKISKNGYLFASGPGGVWIFNPSGKPVARIYTGQATSNTALSADEKTLYITCDDYFYRVRLK